MQAADQEQGAGDNPAVGAGLAGQHAHRLPERAIRRRLERVGDQPGPPSSPPAIPEQAKSRFRPPGIRPAPR
jgi:hypothetical protein